MAVSKWSAATRKNLVEEIAEPGRLADASDQRTTDEPKLCPDPGPDAPHGASERAKAYQEQISRLNNPQRPLLRGEAVSLINPQTGDPVAFDDCRESDGTMIEAKGPGFAQQLKYAYFDTRIVPSWEEQARMQLAAAGSPDVNWYFAEPEAAEKARRFSGNDDKLRKITVIYVPAENQ